MIFIVCTAKGNLLNKRRKSPSVSSRALGLAGATGLPCGGNLRDYAQAAARSSRRSSFSFRHAGGAKRGLPFSRTGDRSAVSAQLLKVGVRGHFLDEFLALVINVSFLSNRHAMNLTCHPLFLSAAASLVFNFSVLAVDAVHPEGLAEFKWGATLDETRKAMQAHAEVTLSDETPNTLEYAGGSVANEPVQSWKFTFTDGKLDDIVVFLTPSNLEQAYASLRKGINEKYRKRGEEKRQRHPPCNLLALFHGQPRMVCVVQYQYRRNTSALSRQAAAKRFPCGQERLVSKPACERLHARRTARSSNTTIFDELDFACATSSSNWANAPGRNSAGADGAH